MNSNNVWSCGEIFPVANSIQQQKYKLYKKLLEERAHESHYYKCSRMSETM